MRAVDQGLAPDVLPLLVAATDFQQITSFDAGTALCAALAGDHERAQAGLVRLLTSGFRGSPRGADWLTPTAFLAHTCVLIGALAEAEPLYKALSGARAKVVRVGPLAGWWGPVDHHLGSLAQLLGRRHQAERHLRDALDLEEAMGARPFAARSLAELSRVVGATDPERGATWGKRAVAVAAGVGAAGVLAEVEAIVSSGAAGI